MNKGQVTPLVTRPDDTLPIFQNFGLREFYSPQLEALLQQYRDVVRYEVPMRRPVVVLFTDGPTVGKVRK